MSDVGYSGYHGRAGGCRVSSWWRSLAAQHRELAAYVPEWYSDRSAVGNAARL